MVDTTTSVSDCNIWSCSIWSFKDSVDLLLELVASPNLLAVLSLHFWDIPWLQRSARILRCKLIPIMVAVFKLELII